MQPTQPTEFQKYAMILSIQITCTASIIMIMAVISCYIFVKRLRSIEFLMIVLTCIGDLITTLAICLAVTYDNTDHTMDINQISQYEKSTACIVQAWFVQFGGMFSFVWTANIAYATKMSIMFLTPQQRQNKIKIMFVIGFTLPLIFTIIPLISDSYSLSMYPISDTICQMKGGQNNHLGNFILFLCFYIPLILVITFNTVCMYQVIRTCQIITTDERTIREVKHLLLYPIILVICWISFLTLRIIDSFSDPTLYTFQIICMASSKMMGFFNGLAYGSNTLIKVLQTQILQKTSQPDGQELDTNDNPDI